jgi:hypothetical protein
MAFVLLVGLIVCHSVAIPLSGMLVYHDINDKADSKGREKTFAVFLEVLQIVLSGASIFAVVVALRSGSHVHWYDAVALCNLQLFVGNNVELPPFLDRLC